MNPYDVFPRRNLPPESEEWGRKVEDRIVEVENIALTGDQGLSGLNRSNAAQLQDLSRQVADLETQVIRIDGLYAALPKTFAQNAVTTGFGLSAGWQTIASVSFTPPQNGRCILSANASGQLKSGSTSTNMEVSYRLVVNGGSASPAIPGNYASPDGVWLNSFVIPYGWTVTGVLPVNPITVSLQANPVNPASWGSGTGSYAALAVLATFTV